MPIRELLRCSVTSDLFSIFRMQEEFEDTKGVIKSKKTNQWPKEQTTIYKTSHIKLKIK